MKQGACMEGRGSIECMPRFKWVMLGKHGAIMPSLTDMVRIFAHM